MRQSETTGLPHVVPVWYHYDGQDVLVVTAKDSVKTKNIGKNPSVSPVVDDVRGEAGDISYFTGTAAVVIEGRAEIKKDVDANAFAKELYKRYVGEQTLSHPMMQYMMTVPKCVIAIRLARMFSWDSQKMGG
ncbi:MAG: pyridoxamine 5'-phosphate oxidase family protein [Nitrososphaera sp.]|uniref:pyridoxamine 5'-phosphate oxidase family protein n=1 Tax=Nitrososphaera sp. TaxID=1971748 RepID=UPI003D6F5422